MGSILKFCIGFPFGENSVGFCKFVWVPGSILNFPIGCVSPMLSWGVDCRDPVCRHRFRFPGHFEAPLTDPPKTQSTNPQSLFRNIHLPDRIKHLGLFRTFFLGSRSFASTPVEKSNLAACPTRRAILCTLNLGKSKGGSQTGA